MFFPAHLNAESLTTKAKSKLRFKGFTLIELLIVIAILGILAAAVLIAVNPKKRQDQAKDANIKSDIGSIATAAQAYYTQPGQGSYPLTLLTLETNGDLKRLPVPPAGGTYEYFISPSATCDGTVIIPCTEAAVSEPLFDHDPAVGATSVWCWRSSTGKASEVLPAACTAP